MEGSGVERGAWLGCNPCGDKRSSGNLPEKISVALAAEEMCQQLMKYDFQGKLQFSYQWRESTSLTRRRGWKWRDINRNCDYIMPGTYLLPKDTLRENWAIGEAPDRHTKFIIVAITSAWKIKLICTDQPICALADGTGVALVKSTV